jgi:hypothetical protein
VSDTFSRVWRAPGVRTFAQASEAMSDTSARATCTRSERPIDLGYDPGVAQLVEHRTVHPSGAGSNPAPGAQDTEGPRERAFVWVPQKQPDRPQAFYRSGVIADEAISPASRAFPTIRSRFAARVRPPLSRCR